MASSASNRSSWSVNTLPVGLCGLLSSRIRVRGVIATRSSSGSNVHVPAPSTGGRSGTGRATPPAMAIPAA